MNEPTKNVLLKVVAEAMEWKWCSMGECYAIQGPLCIFKVSLDDDTSQGNQIAIAQMMLWLAKSVSGFQAESDNFGWEAYSAEVAYGGDECLSRALAKAVYAVRSSGRTHD